MSDIFDELRAALWSVWHRRWLAVAVAWGVCLLGWVAVSLIPNTYESKARVYVDVEDVLSKQLGIAGDGKQQIMRVRQTLSSAKNLEKVVTSTRLGEGITARGALDAATAELEKKVKVSSEQDNLFEITAAIGRRDLDDAENAVLARDVVQKLLDILREEYVIGSRNGISTAIGDLDRQLEERKAELEQAEQRRLTFEAQYPDLAGGSDSLSNKVQEARAELAALMPIWLRRRAGLPPSPARSRARRARSPGDATRPARRPRCNKPRPSLPNCVRAGSPTITPTWSRPPGRSRCLRAKPLRRATTRAERPTPPMPRWSRSRASVRPRSRRYRPAAPRSRAIRPP
jgi:capsular polysaccharide biosynthesis protein